MFNCLIGVVLIVDPVRSIEVQEACNDLFFVWSWHCLFMMFKIIWELQVYSHIGLRSEYSVVTFDPKLFLFVKLALTLFDFEVKEPVRLTRPCDCPNEDLGHLDFAIGWCRGSNLTESAHIFVNWFNGASRIHSTLTWTAGSHFVWI